MSDNAWLAAYEAQKAAVLKKMQQKSGPDSSSGSVSGTSKFSGLVDVSAVGHVTKSNEVTKLMNNLKKQSDCYQVKPQRKEHKFSDVKTPPESVQPEQAQMKASTKTPQATMPLARPVPGPSISAEFQVTSKPAAPYLPNVKADPGSQVMPESSTKSSKRKKGEGGEMGIKDLIKKVKSDAARKPTDWAEVGYFLLAVFSLV